MNDRIHRALDGELPFNGLSRTEAQEVDRTRSLFDDVSRSIPSHPVPRLGDSVMNRIAARESNTRKESWKRLIGWFWAPRGFAIRPAYAIALAAMAVIAIGSLTARGIGNPGVAAVPNGKVFVHFRLEAPHASTVSLAGDFSNWSPAYHMRRSEPGVWTIVVPLNPGVHAYSFIVDGNTWVPDPAAPAIADGFGGVNSRIAVITPDAGRSL